MMDVNFQGSFNAEGNNMGKSASASGLKADPKFAQA
jgi:hypothetical protein